MEPRVKYLLSLGAIRDRAKVVGDAANAGKLSHFDLHEDKLGDAVDFVASVIKRDFGPDKFDTIPPHGRWQHFEVGNVPRIADAMEAWKSEVTDAYEMTRRLIDLFFISVLLDAGAGDHWRYTEPGTGHVYERSEGIAVASLHMFQSRMFTYMPPDNGVKVYGKSLTELTTEALAEGFQVSDQNPMVGLESRAALLRSLGQALLDRPDVFGPRGRPGLIVDYMGRATGNSSTLDVHVLWDVLQELLIPIWPKDRTVVDGVPIGDAWPLSTLETQASSSPVPADDSAAYIQPFHKLTQWLTYSLMVPFQRIMDVTWVNTESLTGLPEYRNGGLFVDLGVLTFKPDSLERGLKASGGELPQFEAGDDVIVEWRAMTLVLLDRLYGEVLSRMGDGVHLSMAQVLEAGTWKSGREIAAQRRPETKSSPILIKSDGTVF